MLTFPQLTSGAMAQMPIQRAIRFRSRRNDARDGSVVQLGDPDYEERIWDLRFVDLTDAEWDALAGLFAATEGRLGAFAFLEPGANLLSWSEHLLLPPWVVAGAATDLQPDPSGGARGSRIAAGSSANQSIEAPSSYRYTASAWLRTSSAGAKIRLDDSATQATEADIEASGQWKRYVLRYTGSSSTNVMRLSLNAGSSDLNVYGPQLEPQSSASVYKLSTSQAGVFSNTRFDQDRLIDEASGVGRHDARVRLLWTPSQL